MVRASLRLRKMNKEKFPVTFQMFSISEFISRYGNDEQEKKRRNTNARLHYAFVMFVMMMWLMCKRIKQFFLLI